MASEGFFERVYEVVEQIPEGMVATYGQVALLDSLSSRGVCRWPYL